LGLTHLDRVNQLLRIIFLRIWRRCHTKSFIMAILKSKLCFDVFLPAWNFFDTRNNLFMAENALKCKFYWFLLNFFVFGLLLISLLRQQLEDQIQRKLLIRESGFSLVKIFEGKVWKIILKEPWHWLIRVNKK